MAYVSSISCVLLYKGTLPSVVVDGTTLSGLSVWSMVHNSIMSSESVHPADKDSAKILELEEKDWVQMQEEWNAM
jgi:hypothetical protein